MNRAENSIVISDMVSQWILVVTWPDLTLAELSVLITGITLLVTILGVGVRLVGQPIVSSIIEQRRDRMEQHRQRLHEVLQAWRANLVTVEEAAVIDPTLPRSDEQDLLDVLDTDVSIVPTGMPDSRSFDTRAFHDAVTNHWQALDSDRRTVEKRIERVRRRKQAFVSTYEITNKENGNEETRWPREDIDEDAVVAFALHTLLTEQRGGPASDDAVKQWIRQSLKMNDSISVAVPGGWDDARLTLGPNTSQGSNAPELIMLYTVDALRKNDDAMEDITEIAKELDRVQDGVKQLRRHLDEALRETTIPGSCDMAPDAALPVIGKWSSTTSGV